MYSPAATQSRRRQRQRLLLKFVNEIYNVFRFAFFEGPNKLAKCDQLAKKERRDTCQKGTGNQIEPGVAYAQPEEPHVRPPCPRQLRLRESIDEPTSQPH